MAACREAIALTPQDWIAHLDLGVSRSTLARWRIDTGGDPMPLIAEARLDLERSLAIDANVITLRYVGQVEQTAARWAALQGQDAAPMFAAAEPCSSVQLARHAGPSALIVRANITNPLRHVELEVPHHGHVLHVRSGNIRLLRCSVGARFSTVEPRPGSAECVVARSRKAQEWRSLNAKLW
jgi:hypothetical protein